VRNSHLTLYTTDVKNEKTVKNFTFAKIGLIVVAVVLHANYAMNYATNTWKNYASNSMTRHIVVMVVWKSANAS
jgi:hypothetical protein